MNKVSIVTINYNPPKRLPALQMDKELIGYYRVIAYERLQGEESNFHCLVHGKLYQSRRADGASPVYCSVWLHNPKTRERTSGRGSATGCGYHKASAAFASALIAAGVKVDPDIDGRGDSAIEDALKAVAEYMGFAEFEVFSG